MMRKISDHAVVLGASMSGLLAARVLTDAYQRVTVVDRDPLPSMGQTARGYRRPTRARVAAPRRADPRRTVPGDAGRPGGGRGAGASRLPRGVVLGGGYLLRRQGEPGDPVYQPSRAFLEGQVRKRVQALPNVLIRDRCEVAGLATTPACDRVTGARVLPGGRGAEEILTADLLVDAIGRSGRTPAWLRDMGHDPPAEDQVRVNITYATRHLRLRPGAWARRS
jgi:2-polyprenyl-6-methoxyphenol hydroxylase-like FAD-dependent oxidoreductase